MKTSASSFADSSRRRGNRQRIMHPARVAGTAVGGSCALSERRVPSRPCVLGAVPENLREGAWYAGASRRRYFSRRARARRLAYGSPPRCAAFCSGSCASRCCGQGRALRRHQGEPLEDDELGAAQLPSDDPSPAMQVLAQRSHDEVAEAMLRVCSLREQEVLLFDLEEATDKAIAAALDLSEGHVRVVRHRAISKLRAALSEAPKPRRSLRACACWPPFLTTGDHVHLRRVPVPLPWRCLLARNLTNVASSQGSVG